jgi:uncharacterized GH25 family protein
MKKIAISFFALVATITLVLSGTAFSHEFILKPVQMNPSPDQRVPFSVVSAHVFMVSEEMEPVDQVSVRLHSEGKPGEIALSENPTRMTLDGAAKIPGEGTHILAGHRKGMIWTQTTQGWKQAGKKGLTGVISSGLYEKFCKTLMTAGTPDDGYKTVLGQTLEIVPVENPAELRTGDETAFRILYDGKPISTEVLATYDGFSNRPGTYAYFTESNAEGMAHVQIDHPGTWMVRAEHKMDDPTEDYDTHVLRSVLVFDVR